MGLEAQAVGLELLAVLKAGEVTQSDAALSKRERWAAGMAERRA